MSICAILALAGLAIAQTESLLNTDFTAVSAMPNGWTSGQWNGWNTPHFSFSSNKGASVAKPWKQNSLEHAITLSPNGSYVIRFSTYASTANVGAMIYLSSSSANYSFVAGNCYDTHTNVYMGYWNAAIDTRTSNDDTGSFVNFQEGNVPTAFDSSSNSNGTINVGGALDYTIKLNGSALTLTVQDASSASWTKSVTLKENVAFDRIIFGLDGGGGTVGLKNVSVTVPEPATATLSLLALAGLAARRRRA